MAAMCHGARCAPAAPPRPRAAGAGWESTATAADLLGWPAAGPAGLAPARAAARRVASRSRRVTRPPRAQWTEVLNQPLSETDPELFDIIEHEKRRQRDNIVLIASEVR